jgi:hypothetical protein
LEEIDDEDHNCYDEQNVNEIAPDGADESEKPENEKNNEDSPEHRFLWLSWFRLCIVREWRSALTDTNFLIGQIWPQSSAFT